MISFVAAATATWRGPSTNPCLGLGPLGSLNQVIVALGKTIRAMADGSLDSQMGARTCNGLGIMRACMETAKLEVLENRMDEIADRVAKAKTGSGTDTREAHVN